MRLDRGMVSMEGRYCVISKSQICTDVDSF